MYKDNLKTLFTVAQIHLYKMYIVKYIHCAKSEAYNLHRTSKGQYVFIYLSSFPLHNRAITLLDILKKSTQTLKVFTGSFKVL